MPRLQRNVPPGLGRFHYWLRSVAFPQDERVPGELSDDDIGHQYCAVEFRAMLLGTSKVDQALKGFDPDNPTVKRIRQDRAKADARASDIRTANLRRLFGDTVEDPKAAALCWYITTDTVWEQNEEAWTVLKTLDRRIQEELKAFSRKRWHYKGPWQWKILLATIARDQEVFREITNLGPTNAGLVGSKRQPDIEPEKLAWKRWRYKAGTVKTVYLEYRKQMGVLLGEGFLIPPRLSEDYRAAGLLDDKGRIPLKPFMRVLEGKTPSERKRYTDPALHWFAHALRNLCRYRDGHLPLPWQGEACAAGCRKEQQKLCLTR